MHAYIRSMTNQSGRFSTDGISVTAANSTFVQCTSNHLTSFAVLVDVSGVSYMCNAYSIQKLPALSKMDSVKKS